MNTDKRLIDAMIAEFKKHTGIEKVVLFGSRARGDNTERSDYDIAIYGSLTRDEVSNLRLTFDEDLPTLHKIDLIFMQDKLSTQFRNSIETEGLKIYG